MAGEEITGLMVRAWKGASGWVVQVDATKTASGAREWTTIYRTAMPSPLRPGGSLSDAAAEVYYYATLARHLAERRRVRR